MKIKWGAIVVDGRGKIGGHVASKNRAGAYLRTKVTPSNPQTTYQTSIRSLFGAISAAWSGLTEPVRSAWNGAVESWQSTDVFGDIKNPTGKALHQQLNTQAQVVDYPAVVTPPVALPMVSGVVTAGDIAIGAATLTFTGSYAGADATIQVHGTALLSNGTSFVKNKLRVIYFEVGSTYDSAAAYTAYLAKFGLPTAGSNVYLAVKYILPTGQASPLQIVKSTIVA